MKLASTRTEARPSESSVAPSLIGMKVSCYSCPNQGMLIYVECTVIPAFYLFYHSQLKPHNSIVKSTLGCTDRTDIPEGIDWTETIEGTTEGKE